MKANVSRSTLIGAYAIAICADFLQIFLFPLFWDGIVSPLDDATDVLVCATLSYLIGFHVAFLPSFLIKLIPFVESVPTWTLSVFIATRRRVVAGDKPEVIVEEEKTPKLLPGKNE